MLLDFSDKENVACQILVLDFLVHVHTAHDGACCKSTVKSIPLPACYKILQYLQMSQLVAIGANDVSGGSVTTVL